MIIIIVYSLSAGGWKSEGKSYFPSAESEDAMSWI